jgi:hypothetical protein
MDTPRDYSRADKSVDYPESCPRDLSIGSKDATHGVGSVLPQSMRIDNLSQSSRTESSSANSKDIPTTQPSSHRYDAATAAAAAYPRNQLELYAAAYDGTMPFRWPGIEVLMESYQRYAEGEHMFVWNISILGSCPGFKQCTLAW